MENGCGSKVNVPAIFGSQVFNDDVMREKLPKDVYKSLRKTIDQGKDLDINVANAVANAMKDWAVEKGATHYTHWFQPLTDFTAEKHDSFISPTTDGRVIMDFSGKELIKGEPDASSFPSGGLRATFEARGYTAWDPTSYAFIKDGSLYIPTIFCSYSGEVLDKKTPLLRSAEALSDQAVRILRLFGDTATTRAVPTVGAEQEYFLIDRRLYEQREDLRFCGRTLFGAKPPKGQELDDHYFGSIKPRVSAFMHDLDTELWKLGILAKTKHNEVAPAQHELAPIFVSVNTATDHNQLMMETMKNVAARHGLACLLHEKPFAGVNGSGKHNNWSITTDSGKNLLEPGRLPHENAQFLLFVTAVVKGVDEHQDLLRASVASAGNDHRLGGSEAPPAVISVFLGDELTAILDSIESGIGYDDKGCSTMEIGVHVLPTFPRDTTDRNRTSPFAFTGNKFEFRMLGSQISIACPNIILNTIVADELKQFADELETAEDFKKALNELIQRTLKEHKRIIFNGDGYSQWWQEEAERRGLLNLRTTADAMPLYVQPKNLELFARHHVYTSAEMHSRCEVILETYSKTLHIEALTMIDMVQREILPAVSRFSRSLAETIVAKRNVSPEIPCAAESDMLRRVSSQMDEAYRRLRMLQQVMQENGTGTGPSADADYYRDTVIPAMAELRGCVDILETLLPEEAWPMPTYSELLYEI